MVVELSHIEKYEMDVSLVLAGHEPGLHGMTAQVRPCN
jgi:hypothetical protein